MLLLCQKPEHQACMEGRSLLQSPAKLRVASAHCSWTRWAQHLASPTPAWVYLHCQPGWLLVYTRTSAPWSATHHTSHFATWPPPAVIWLVPLVRKPQHAGGASSPATTWALSPADLGAWRFSPKSPPATQSAWNKEWAWSRQGMVSCEHTLLRRGPVDGACPCCGTLFAQEELSALHVLQPHHCCGDSPSIGLSEAWKAS